MHAINQIPPDRMTPEQRRHEIASLLANGLERLRRSGVAQPASWPQRASLNLLFRPNEAFIRSPTHL